jgi:cation:H+ antiporter
MHLAPAAALDSLLNWVSVFSGLTTSDSLALNFCLLLVGLALITKGGDLFTDSAINVARATRIPPAIIGATIVSMATTFPELMVSLTGVWRGSVDLGVGNALGSCCCNIGLVVGACALLNGVVSRSRGVKPGIIARRKAIIGPAVFMLLGGISLWAFGASEFSLNASTHALLAWHGVALGLILLAYLVYSAVLAVHTRYESGVTAEEAEAVVALRGFVGKEVFFFSIGALLVFLGSRQLVSSASQIAAAMNVSEMVIGLTIVSIGTSLPEFTIAVMSVLKGHGELGIGNILGANVINICGVLAACTLVSPLPIDPRLVQLDLPIMLLLMVLLPLTSWRAQCVSARSGALMLSVYGLYMVMLQVL